VRGEDKNVLGFAAYRTNSREGGKQTTFLYELQLAVSARGTKPSLAKALISEVEKWACLLGRGRLMLNVHKTNLLAAGFYEHGCGFSKVCEVEDCIVMEKMCLLEAPAQLLEAQGPSSAAYRALACSPLLHLPALRLLLRSGASNPTTSLKASWKDPHLSTAAPPPPPPPPPGRRLRARLADRVCCSPIASAAPRLERLLLPYALSRLLPVIARTCMYLRLTLAHLSCPFLSCL
jgi:hypothetical protein